MGCQASGLALIVLIVAFFIAFFQECIGVIGTTAIFASLIFILVSFVRGYLLDGSDGSKKTGPGVGNYPEESFGCSGGGRTQFFRPRDPEAPQEHQDCQG